MNLLRFLVSVRAWLWSLSKFKVYNKSVNRGVLMYCYVLNVSIRINSERVEWAVLGFMDKKKQRNINHVFLVKILKCK